MHLRIKCIKISLILSQELAVDLLQTTRRSRTQAPTIAMIVAAITDRVTIVDLGNSATQWCYGGPTIVI